MIRELRSHMPHSQKVKKKKKKKVNRAKKLKTKTVQRGMADEVEGR